jgi:hypothetical protein
MSTSTTLYLHTLFVIIVLIVCFFVYKYYLKSKIPNICKSCEFLKVDKLQWYCKKYSYILNIPIIDEGESKYVFNKKEIIIFKNLNEIDKSMCKNIPDDNYFENKRKGLI